MKPERSGRVPHKILQGRMKYKMDARQFEVIFASLLALTAVTVGNAQATKDVQNLPEAPPAHSIEDLNYLGGDAAMPSFSDSIISVDSNYRKTLSEKGLAF